VVVESCHDLAACTEMAKEDSSGDGAGLLLPGSSSFQSSAVDANSTYSLDVDIERQTSGRINSL
jgi:hypothetical protein